MSLTAAEQKVRKLARLPSNCECANCGTTKKFGFSTVCIKYFTFVCNNCKSSHQAISHRCKSLTMSSWSDAEAAELQQKGNDYARRTWLKNAPPVGVGGRPKEGDHVDVFKRFVVDVYERKRYYGEDDGAPAASASTPSASMPAVATAIPLSRPQVGISPPPRAAPQFSAPVRAPMPAPAPPPAPQPAPVADLLDFSSTPAMTTSAPVNNNESTFTADFDAFVPKVPAPAPVAVAPAPPAAHDPFQPNFDSVALSTITPDAAAPSSSGFSFISAPAPAAPAVVVEKKPVMSNHTMSEKSNFISTMNVSAQQPSSHGFGGGMGMPSNNNMNMMNGMNNMGGMNMMNNMGGMNMNGMNMNAMNMNGMNMNNMGGMSMNGMNGMNMSGMNGMNMMNSMNMMNGNPTMMSQQQQRMMMMNGGGSGGNFNNNNNNGKKNPNSMNSLDMNISSMNAWTTGNK
jgi:Putative GTPase activating protein for Arf